MNIDKLTADIMNIPCKRSDDDFSSTQARLLYKEGHRDARHDAVGMVLEHAQQDAVPYGYVLKTGHGNQFSETLDNIPPESHHLWVAVYKNHPAVAPSDATGKADAAIAVQQAQSSAMGGDAVGGANE